MDERARNLQTIGDKLFSDKASWNSANQEIAEQFHPLRADWTTSFSPGEDFWTGLMDSYPVQARETLGNVPGSMLRQGDWFQITTGHEELDEDPSVGRWLERSTKILRRDIKDIRANFTKAMTEADHDWATFGNPVLSVEESPTRDHLLFRAWHPKDNAWMVNEVGRVDHLHRKIRMTARNMVRRWKDKVPAKVRETAEKSPATEFDCRHIVLPLDEFYGGDRKALRKYRGMPFVSLYICCGDEHAILSESGLPSFSYVVPRWRTISGYPQGFSPATITALPDARMLQDIGRIVLEAGEKTVDPPLAGNGSIFRDDLNLFAGGWTAADLAEDTDADIRKHIMQLPVTGNVNFGMELKADVRALIAESFLLNRLWLPPADRAMTAYEVQQRMAEFRRAVLPFFGPYEDEVHLAVLETALAIEMRNAVLPFGDAPKKLADYLGEDGTLTFTFEGPLNEVEGRSRLAAYQETVQVLAAAMQVDQAAPSLLKFMDATKDAIRGTGAPADWFADDEEAAAAQEQADEMAGLAQAAQMLNAGAGVAGQVGVATQELQKAGLA